MATSEKRYLDQKQRRHLERRVARATSERKSVVWDERNKRVASSPAVNRAKAKLAELNAIVNADDAKRRKTYESAITKIEAASRKCEESINFASPEEALRIVQQFEKSA